jgi:hypothetical protein
LYLFALPMVDPKNMVGGEHCRVHAAGGQGDGGDGRRWERVAAPLHPRPHLIRIRIVPPLLRRHTTFLEPPMVNLLFLEQQQHQERHRSSPSPPPRGGGGKSSTSYRVEKMSRRAAPGGARQGGVGGERRCTPNPPRLTRTCRHRRCDVRRPGVAGQKEADAQPWQQGQFPQLRWQALIPQGIVVVVVIVILLLPGQGQVLRL